MASDPLSRAVPICWLAMAALLFASSVILAFIVDTASNQNPLIPDAARNESLFDIYRVFASYNHILSFNVLLVILAGLYRWFEKIFGVRYNPVLAVLNVSVVFIGLGMIVKPLYEMTLLDIAHYRPGIIIDHFYLYGLSRLGVAVTLAGFAIFPAIVIDAMRRNAQRRSVSSPPSPS